MAKEKPQLLFKAFVSATRQKIAAVAPIFPPFLPD